MIDPKHRIKERIKQSHTPRKPQGDWWNPDRGANPEGMAMFAMKRKHKRKKR